MMLWVLAEHMMNVMEGAVVFGMIRAVGNS